METWGQPEMEENCNIHHGAITPFPAPATAWPDVAAPRRRLWVDSFMRPSWGWRAAHPEVPAPPGGQAGAGFGGLEPDPPLVFWPHRTPRPQTPQFIQVKYSWEVLSLWEAKVSGKGLFPVLCLSVKVEGKRCRLASAGSLQGVSPGGRAPVFSNLKSRTVSTDPQDQPSQVDWSKLQNKVVLSNDNHPELQGAHTGCTRHPVRRNGVLRILSLVWDGRTSDLW